MLQTIKHKASSRLSIIKQVADFVNIKQVADFVNIKQVADF